ncbi:hypothetical protein ACFXTH_006854 [Malus domestica]
MYDLVEPLTEGTLELECIGFANVDHESEATLSPRGKEKAKTGHQGKRILPSTSNLTIHYEFVPWRKFNEFAQLMEVQLRTILEELEVELGARRALVANVERLLANIGDQLFQKVPSPKKSFKLDADLGESQVMYLREEDDDMEVSEHNGQNKEGFEVNKVVGPSNFKPLLDKGIRQKRKGMQLVHPFTPFQGYKKKEYFQ